MALARSARTLGMLVLMSIVATGSCGILTGTGFPWEGCQQDQMTARYSAYLSKYFQNEESMWTFCMKITVMDEGACLERNGFPKNRTRCCDTDLNKLKIWPAGKCRQGTVGRLTVNGDIRSSWTWEEKKNGNFILKFTPLKLTPQIAEDTEICLSLRPNGPCPTMREFAANGRILEWALYDKKRNNYECCPTGFDMVVDEEYSADGEPLPEGPSTVPSPRSASPRPSPRPSPKAVPSPVVVPSPVAEVPSPVVEVPSPVVEVPSPVVEVPSPVVEVPSPVEEASPSPVDVASPVEEPSPSPVEEVTPSPLPASPKRSPIRRSPSPRAASPRRPSPRRSPVRRSPRPSTADAAELPADNMTPVYTGPVDTGSTAPAS